MFTAYQDIISPEVSLKRWILENYYIWKKVERTVAWGIPINTVLDMSTRKPQK
jgi:hypothetical protein